MARAKPTIVDSFGRVLIPKDVRVAAGLHEGTELEVIRDGRTIRLVPRDEGVLLAEREGVVVIVGEAEGDLVGAVEKARASRSRKLSGW